MKKSMSVFKRLLAMLLVFAMVIGYMPAYSFAADGSVSGDVEDAAIAEAEEKTPFVVTVTRTEYKEAAPEEQPSETPSEEPSETPSEEPSETPGEDPTEAPTEAPADPLSEDSSEETPSEDPSEETPGETPDQGEVQKAAYNYAAVLEIDGEAVDAADVEITWAYGQNGEFKVTGPSAENVSEEYTEVVLKVTYDGITLTDTVKESDFAQADSTALRLKAAMECGEVKLGAPVSAPEEAATQNFAGKWAVSEWNVDYVENGYVVNDAEGAVELATLQLRGQAAEGEEPVVYLEMPWNVKIVPVKYTASIAVTEGTQYGDWYNTAVTAVVTVTGDASVKDSSFVNATVQVDGKDFSTGWSSSDNGKSWQSDEIKLESGEHTVSACGSEFSFKIDTVVPTVTTGDTYYTYDNGEQVTVINFSYTVGESGVEKISVSDGQQIIKDNVDTAAGSVTVPGWIENPEIIVMGNNGLSNNAKPVPQGALTVTVEGPAENAVIGTVDGVVYAPQGELTVAVEGAEDTGAFALDTDNSVISALDQNGAAIEAGNWTYQNGKWTAKVSLANGLSELSVNVVDAKGREASVSHDQKYAVDNEAPEITAVRDIEPVNTVGDVEYYNDTVTYRFTIEDILLGDAESYVIYQIDGQEPVKVTFNNDGNAVFEVKNGQKLTSLTIYGCDASGNETKEVAKTWTTDTGLTCQCNVIVDTEDPEVSVKTSANVKAFYTDTNGRVYAVLRDNSALVTLTVTVVDENLSEDCFTADGTEWEITYNEEKGVYEAVAEFSVEVADHTTGVLNYAFTCKDLANRTPAKDLILEPSGTQQIENGLVPGTTLTGTDGVYEGKIYVDRRAPSSVDEGAPQIVLKPSVAPARPGDEDTIDLFAGAFAFTLEVYDRTNGNTDSGVRYIEWTLEDPDGVVKPINKNNSSFSLEENVDGSYPIPVELLQAIGESNDVKVTIWVKDHVLNTIMYVKTFGVDTKIPEIQTSFDNENASNENHYKGDRTLSVTVTDLNLKDAQLIVNGVVEQNITADSDTITFTREFTQGGVYNVEIKAADLAGNANSVTIGEFIIDQDPPVVTVTKTVEAGKDLIASKNGVDYHNGEVTYTVTVTDDYLSNASGATQVAAFTYTLEDGTSKTVTLPASEDGWVKDADADTYTYSFTVTDGQVLTGMTIQAEDNAGNPMKAVDGVPFADDDKDGVWTYTGNAVVVDKTAPVINVTKEQTPVHTYEDHDYYDQDVTYTIEVTDNFLNKDVTEALTAVVIYTDGSEENVELKLKPAENTENAAAAKLADSDIYTGSFTLKGEKVMASIEISVKDNAGNTAEFPDAAAAQFELENGVWTYTGNPIVVDKEDPTAEITFSENVDAFYMNGNTIYAVLSDGNRVEGDSGKAAGEAQTVTVTIEVTDKNLAIDNENVNGVKAGTFGWTGETPVNTESTITYTAEATAAPDGAAVFTVDVQVVDLAGRYLTNVKVNETDNNTNLGKTVPVIPGVTDGDDLVNGSIKFGVYVDRRRPTSGNEADVPTITIEPTITPTATASGLDLFNGAFDFKLHVADVQEEGINTGLNYVKWTVNDPNGVVESYETNNPYEYGTHVLEADYVIPVTLKTNPGESNDVTLTIEVMDNVGNLIKYVKTFGVDTKDPRISYTYSDTPTNGNYYDNPIDVTVTIEDLNMDVAFGADAGHYITIAEYDDPDALNVLKEYPIDQMYVNENGTIVYTYVLPFDAEGVYGVTTAVKDLANNESDKQAKANSFVLDMTAPEINVTKTVEEGKGLIHNASGVDYYNGEVTYTVTIADRNLSAVPGGVNAAVLTYTFEDGTTYTVSLDAAARTDEWTVFQYMDGKTYYQYEFTVGNDQVLTGMTIQAMDNASNPAKAANLTCEDVNTVFAYDEQTNTHTYTGQSVAVDKVAPVITFEKVGTAVQTYAVDGTDRDYHDAEVTYTITVKDNFLNDGVAENYVKYFITNNEGKTTEMAAPLTAAAGEGLMVTEDTFTYTFTVKDGEVLEDIQFMVKDNAGNVAVFPAAQDAETAQFAQDNDVWGYTGNPIVVDMTAPIAKLTFSDNVDSFYMNGTTVYAVLTTPVEADSGMTAEGEQKVTMTLTVNDLNLTIDNANVNGVKDRTDDGFGWTGNTPVNQATTITYTADSGKVNPDGTHTFEIDLQILDLAGNLLTQDNLEIVPAKGDSQLGSTVADVKVDEAANIGFTVSVDRRRPSSSDVDAPTITIEPSIVPTTTAGAEPVDLFSNAFSFALHVTDGDNNDKNSGINYVKWEIVDPNGVVRSYETLKEYTERILQADYTIDVPLNVAQGESNDVKLTIWAMDNVGNTIKFEKTFGVDNLAPRVTITQSNHSVQNEFYFKDDQVITVTIEDLNFEPTTSSVTTEVSFNGWQSIGGNKYQTVLTYNRDGDYTFEMQTTDRANNAAVIDYTTGLTALQKFTIDKTAPIINVTFNPAVAVDTDGAGVQYFDQNRSVTVTINEHNFRASDVVSNLGAKNALGAWRTSGDTHTAGDVFYEGNNYSVSVQYTDLAGNPAQPYTSPKFSVDLGLPTIDITKGNMELGQLNTVPDDLLLGFTINDEQNNLKNFSVEVMFLDSRFQQTKVEGAEFYTVSGQGDRTNGYIDFTNIEKVKANDGIYTVRVTAVDYAGHVVTLMSDLVFSLNRFGSTFFVEDSYTKDFLVVNDSGIVYRNDVENDLVIKEINPNRVWQDAEKKTQEGSLITVSVNGKAMTLKEGTDYQVSVTENGTGGSKWYEYTYSISKDVFSSGGELVDGEYTIFFYSEDDAANKNTNESNEGSTLTLGKDGNYNGKIVFTLDHKAPVVTIMGIESGESYIEANKSVQIDISDNTPVFIQVYINDTLVEEIEITAGQATDSDWIYYDEATGSYMLNMAEKKVPQDVRVEVIDAAGNKIVTDVTRIMLTEDLWAQYINSLPAKLITVVLLIALIMLIMVLVKKRKKKEEETAAAAQT